MSVAFRYSLKDGQSFVEQARNVVMDLVGDEGVMNRTQKASQLTWDRKKKKFIQGDGVGADNQKIIRTESGARLPMSYKSGRFEEWKHKKRVTLPKIGEAEGDLAGRVGGLGDKRYRHTKMTDAKPLDAKSTTFEKKTYMLKKRAEKEAEAEGGAGLVKTKKGKVVKGVRSGTAHTKSELKSVHEIRKERQILEQVSGRRSCLTRYKLISRHVSSEGPRMPGLRRKEQRARAKASVERCGDIRYLCYHTLGCILIGHESLSHPTIPVLFLSWRFDRHIASNVVEHECVDDCFRSPCCLLLSLN